MTEISLTIETARPEDHQAIEKLHQRAFGPGRFARTAYRIREQAAGTTPIAFVARVGSFLVGSVIMTPVRIGQMPALVLGPLTVEPAFEGRGIGRSLLARCELAARETGSAGILLIGDEPYYGRFGYRRIPMGQITLPGPFDPQRFLLLEIEAGAHKSLRGAVMPPV